MQAQTFLLLRGHQGSGKSTFAEAKTAGFLAQYPNGEVVRIENDLLLTDENGVYRWSPEALDKAQRRGRAAMRDAFKRGQAGRAWPMLVLNSNTNQKSSACIGMMQMRADTALPSKCATCTISLPTHTAWAKPTCWPPI